MSWPEFLNLATQLISQPFLPKLSTQFTQKPIDSRSNNNKNNMNMGAYGSIKCNTVFQWKALTVSTVGGSNLPLAGALLVSFSNSAMARGSSCRSDFKCSSKSTAGPPAAPERNAFIKSSSLYEHMQQKKKRHVASHLAKTCILEEAVEQLEHDPFLAIITYSIGSEWWCHDFFDLNIVQFHQMNNEWLVLALTFELGAASAPFGFVDSDFCASLDTGFAE